MRAVLTRCGFDPQQAEGPMEAAAPGRTSPGDSATTRPDTDPDALLSFEDGAWLIDTLAGRWWLRETGRALPADARAQLFQHLASRRQIAEGRPID